MTPEKNLKNLQKSCVDDVYDKWMVYAENMSTIVFLIALNEAGKESNEKIGQIKQVIDAIVEQSGIPVYTNVKDMRQF